MIIKLTTLSKYDIFEQKANQQHEQMAEWAYANFKGW